MVVGHSAEPTPVIWPPVGWRHIGVIGDRDPANRTHATLDESLAAAGAEWQWVATDAVAPADELERWFAGLWIAPASPYRSMDGALGAITAARERGIPLVGT